MIIEKLAFMRFLVFFGAIFLAVIFLPGCEFPPGAAPSPASTAPKPPDSSSQADPKPALPVAPPMEKVQTPVIDPSKVESRTVIFPQVPSGQSTSTGVTRAAAAAQTKAPPPRLGPIVGAMVDHMPSYASSEFGPRKLFGRKFHHGIDLPVGNGTPIKSVGDGVVAFAGWQKGYGNTLIVKHANGVAVLYAHLKKILLTKGAAVKAGQKVALSGNTGQGTGPHLHFETRVNGAFGKAVNPRSFSGLVLPPKAK